jgi:hypothetical protein
VFKGYLFIHTSMQGLQAIILEDYTEWLQVIIMVIMLIFIDTSILCWFDLMDSFVHSLQAYVLKVNGSDISLGRRCPVG